ncbi:hypothetical protein JDY09_05260 [Thermoleophilum album]|uniref:ribosome maturation factor RimP n=1 Tax=Thermoleophilum album TaxID=29539 RepID=UPI00237D03B4|nr:hypothetical protein [Thermoleophilum album]MCL6441643.1 hypothetical protein [Thermoleophilum sp.]WDT92814.1 hypothetical protein JDY09_05260 [Thermoleophilum album]
MRRKIEELRAEIEQRLAKVEPEVELLACEPAGRERIRLVIDHPQGVDLALCERVTRQLWHLVAEVGLEVSSPGPRRPLTKPAHFRRYLGRRARLRLRAERGGRRTYSGELVGADDRAVTVATESGVVSIPYAEINRGNLLEE